MEELEQISESQLRSVILNQAYKLLAGGVPDKLDFTGFNKPDYQSMVNLLPALSCKTTAEIDPEVMGFIANTLLSYKRQIGQLWYPYIKEFVDRQYNGTSYQMLKFVVQYKTIAEEQAERLTAELLSDEETVEVTFKYSAEMVAAIKSIPGARARKGMADGKTKWFWRFNLRNIDIAIELVSRVGDASDLVQIFEEHEEAVHILKSGAEVVDYIPQGVIRAFKHKDRIHIKFAKDKTILDTVRNFRERQWHPKEEEDEAIRFTWSFSMTQVDEAYAALKDIGCDVSSLEEFTTKLTEHDAVNEEENINFLLDQYQGLFKHQVEGVKWMLTKKRADAIHLSGKILADDMGLGKTRQAIISAFEASLEFEDVDKILVVCPATLKLNWEREILMMYSKDNIFVVNGTGWDVEQVKDANWVIINYDLLKKFEHDILANEWAVIVADEAHYLKNRTSARSKIFIGKKKRTKGDPDVHEGIVTRAKNVYMLTGTPVTSRPVDLFNLLRAVGHPLGKNWKYYTQRYCDAQKTRFGMDVSGASNLKELYEKTRNVILRRTKEQVLDMPDKTRRIIPVVVDLKEYRSYWTEYKLKIEREGKILQSDHLAMLNKLRQSSAIAKIEHSIELIEEILEAGEKVVLFTNFTEVADKVFEHYKGRSVKIVGGMSEASKQQSVDRFQRDPSVDVFVGNIVAAGVGITLTAGTQCIMNDYNFVPAYHTQAEDRLYRIGQKNNVTVTYLNAAGTIDEEVSQLLASKLAIVARVIDGVDDVTDESANITADLIRLLWGSNA